MLIIKIKNLLSISKKNSCFRKKTTESQYKQFNYLNLYSKLSIHNFIIFFAKYQFTYFIIKQFFTKTEFSYWIIFLQLKIALKFSASILQNYAYY